MAQFGAGPEFAAQCPSAPTPDGWRAWLDSDGPIPDALAKRAQALVDDQSIPLGSTESFPLPGVTTLLRLEPRTWSRNAQGALVQGCFRSIGIYLPGGAPAVAASSGPSTLDKVVGVLTAISLVAGIGASIASWKGAG